MPWKLLIQSPGALPREVTLAPGRQALPVAPGEQFRLVSDDEPRPPGLKVRRLSDSLLVDGLPAGISVDLSNFFGACRPGADCRLAIEAPGSEPVAVTPATLPIAALSDGSFLLYGPAEGALPVASAESGGMSPMATAGLGVLALLGVGAVAGGGGGGGDGGGPAAATGAQRGAATPTPAPAPPAAPVPGPVADPVADPVAEPVADPVPTPPPADTAPPGLSITDDSPGTSNRPVVFTFRFEEPVTGFAAEDVAVAGGTRGELALASPDGSVYTLAVVPTAGTAAGLIVVGVPTGAASDGAGNPSTAAQATQAYDTLAPLARIGSFEVRDDVSPRRGTVDPGEFTNDREPTITLTLDETLEQGEVLTLTRDGRTVRTLTGDRTLSFEDGPLGSGTATYSASITDAAGNTTTLDLDGGGDGTAFRFRVI